MLARYRGRIVHVIDVERRRRMQELLDFTLGFAVRDVVHQRIDGIGESQGGAVIPLNLAEGVGRYPTIKPQRSRDPFRFDVKRNRPVDRAGLRRFVALLHRFPPPRRL